MVAHRLMPGERLIVRFAESLERAEQFLKPGLSLAALEEEALSDTECARKMNIAKSRLLRQCKEQSPLSLPFR